MCGFGFLDGNYCACDAALQRRRMQWHAFLCSCTCSPWIPTWWKFQVSFPLYWSLHWCLFVACMNECRVVIHTLVHWTQQQRLITLPDPCILVTDQAMLVSWTLMNSGTQHWPVILHLMASLVQLCFTCGVIFLALAHGGPAPLIELELF
jgi:hypothetical protein